MQLTRRKSRQNLLNRALIGINLLKIHYKLPILLVAFLFSGVSVIQAQEYGDAFIDGSIADARTLVPIVASDTASHGVCGMVFNGLVKYDKDINLVGDLAQSWEIQEEGLVIIFHLRKGVTWHDGQPFTAKDVQFTYEKLIDPNVRTAYSGDFERVESLEVLDDYTVKVRYKEPFSPGLSSWGMYIIPKHILEKEDLNTTAFARNPIGTGPYKFKTWKTQEKIELISYNDYFEKRPYLERVIYRVIPDQSTIFLELQTQGLDSAGLTPLQYKRQTDTTFFRRHYRKFRLPSFGYTYLAYNLNNPKFSDVRIRKALNYAVDKNEIINIVLLGYGKAGTGPFTPESWAYNHAVPPASYDPQKAKELFQEAGWSDSNNDGWLDKDGRIFEFTIVTNQGNEERIKTAEIIQRKLKEIGVKVTIKVIEWSVFLTEYIDKRTFETVLLGWSLSRDPDSYDIWHSSKTKEGEFNFIGYRNAEVDRLLVEARRIFEQDERSRRYHRIHEIVYDEQPYMFLYVADSLSSLHRRFREVKPAPAGIGYNFIYWWVPRQEQLYSTLAP